MRARIYTQQVIYSVGSVGASLFQDSSDQKTASREKNPLQIREVDHNRHDNFFFSFLRTEAFLPAGAGDRKTEAKEKQQVGVLLLLFCFSPHDCLLPESVPDFIYCCFKAFALFIFYFNVIQHGQLHRYTVISRDKIFS